MIDLHRTRGLMNLDLDSVGASNRGSFRSRIGLFGLLPLLIAGCSPDPAPEVPGRSGEMVQGRSCSDDERLELALEATVTSNLRVPPASAAAFGPGGVLFLGGAGTLASVGVDVEFDNRQRAMVFRGLVGHPAGALAFTESSVFLISAGGLEELEVPGDLVPIRTIARDRVSGSFFFVVGDTRSVRVVEVKLSGDRVKLVSEWTAEGNFKVLPGDPTLLVGTTTPFPLLRLAPNRTPEKIGDLAGSEVLLSWPDSAAPYLIGSTSLDCGRGLLTIADTRSRLRALLLVDLESGRLVRSAELNATMGFFDSSPASRQLFGMRLTDEGGEVLVYRWSWVPAA